MVALRLHEKNFRLGKKDFRLEKKILDSKKKISTTFVHYGLSYLFYFTIVELLFSEIDYFHPPVTT